MASIEDQAADVLIQLGSLSASTLGSTAGDGGAGYGLEGAVAGAPSAISSELRDRAARLTKSMPLAADELGALSRQVRSDVLSKLLRWLSSDRMAVPQVVADFFFPGSGKLIYPSNKKFTSMSVVEGGLCQDGKGEMRDGNCFWLYFLSN